MSPTNSKADAALVLGILSIFLNVLYVPGILSIIWGGRERDQNSKARTGFIVVLASAGRAVNSVNKGTGTAPTAGNPSLGIPASPRKAIYNVGDTASTGDFKVTVYDFKNPQPPAKEFNTPKAGMHYVSVDVQITNPDSTKQRLFSSLLGFHLLDAQNHQYDEDLSAASLTPGPPEGEVAAGQSVRGFTAFEVPDGVSWLRLRVQGGITAAGAVFNLV
ncbi:MAG: DUF4352 domain-containing protein [Actinomycetota bacterium]|nr:DUF4352 domain-containing protein [Actinomycetota bacterium]